MRKRVSASVGFTVLLLLIMLTVGHVYGQEQQTNYLQYQEPQPPATSILSSIAYVFTLLVTFAVVIALAYITSRFVGSKFKPASVSQGGRILIVLPLGANRTLQVVEVAGKVLLLGVTDHTINLLQELTDGEEIAKLRDNSSQAGNAEFEQIFAKQLLSLQRMSQKFPGVFSANHSADFPQEKGKRP